MEEKLYTRIEDYLDGNLSGSEQQTFESELQADPSLAAILATVREARQRLRQHWDDESADAALEATLQQLGREHFSGAKQQKKGGAKIIQLPRIMWAVAAGTALLLAAWLFLRPPGQERLYSEYRQFPEAAFTLKSSEPGQQALQTASNAFNRQEYSAALEALQTVLGASPNDLEARFFAGLCQLELEQYPAAIATFQQVRGTPNAWADEAQWYLALSYLRQNNRAACAAELRAIPEGSGHYVEAQELLGGL